ncbi:CAAX amino protease [Gemmatimonadetes bacterium T265]|nr:CAAX amino protease [Gemmatimonadetes bacterium T265]
MPPRPPAARAARSSGSSYWHLSRAPRYSLLFALPLLVAYEGLAALAGDAAGASVRNGADVWLKAPFVALFGPRGPVVFGALVVGGAAVLVWRDVRRARDGVRGRVLGAMLAESAALAAACGAGVGAATGLVLRVLGIGVAAGGAASGGVAALGAPARLMLSLGAGLYEELLFRVVLVGALAALARRAFGLGARGAGAVAVALGALLFAAAHYVGAYGDRLTLESFVFRTIAGLFFSALYLLRGFGITAWTHALYDVGVLVLGGG